MLSQPATKIFLRTDEAHSAKLISQTLGVEIERVRESRMAPSRLNQSRLMEASLGVVPGRRQRVDNNRHGIGEVRSDIGGDRGAGSYSVTSVRSQLPATCSSVSSTSSEASRSPAEAKRFGDHIGSLGNVEGANVSFASDRADKRPW
ncbi:MAG: hypothetical protein ACRD4H_05765 [Candidatus Acidiferrales bacterium]